MALKVAQKIYPCPVCFAKNTSTKPAEVCSKCDEDGGRIIQEIKDLTRKISVTPEEEISALKARRTSLQRLIDSRYPKHYVPSPQYLRF